MRVIDGAAIEEVLEFPALVDVLARAFTSDLQAPPRHHHNICRPAHPDATLLLMPAWEYSSGNVTDGDDAGAGEERGYIGIKIVAVMPDNGARGLAAVQGSYLLLSGLTGQPLAMIDGPILTNWRTAAASALASRYLSRADSSKLLMVGAGGLAPYLIRAHASVRPIDSVTIWNRTMARAQACAHSLRGASFSVTASDDLEQAARKADIITVATLSDAPLILGDWLRPGQHLDTVGAFRPDMRETDDEALRRAALFVDTRAGALSEAGDIIQPLQAGVIGEDAIQADLFDLTAGRHKGRQAAQEITYFKSVGASLEDLAAAIAIYEAL